MAYLPERQKYMKFAFMVEDCLEYVTQVLTIFLIIGPKNFSWKASLNLPGIHY